MLAVMKRNEFDTMDDRGLCSACFAPLIGEFKNIRVGGGDERAFYDSLTDGQQALFMFRIYYDHVIHSPEDLYWRSAYYHAQPVIWSSLKNTLPLIGEQGILQLAEEIEGFLAERNYARSLDSFAATIQDLGRDAELLASFNAFYVQLQQATSDSFNRLAEYIRRHADDFIQLTNESY
ncbi:hypothetical protein K0T92_20390 [Paenibacillus oenotherae]|uniref:Uncharacterized protein n=1 Tax=Paenibacillus oenotherae TaxID=1435645 RepID=A0ABS7DBT7_9BACL|nr:hypothetical protein [Paenibacillus oenotherae]MBW7477081.1 hypothetical protein [Paenibacillus oenotherae]